MEIRPASIAQITKARNGKFVEISDDVQGVANALHAIDPHIRLRYSESGDHYVIYWTDDPNVAAEDNVAENDTYLIFTAQELDHRIVKHMEKVYWKCNQPGYSFADELDAKDKEAKAQKDREWTEKHGPMYERLAWGMRKDLGYDKNRIYVPENIAA